MPTVTADKIIGKGLIAKVDIPKLNSSLIKIGTFKAGESVGVVYSYIQRGGNIYWLFQPTNQRPYLVEHKANRFIITDDIKNVIRQQQLEREKELREIEIEEKGVIPYYIEKYGKYLVLVIAGTVIIKTLITKK
jgi:hypothetical protein